MTRRVKILSAAITLFCSMPNLGAQTSAPQIPAEYQAVLKQLGRTGDYKSGVLKVNVPRNDLHVKIADISAPTPFGFGGWFAMTKGDQGEEVLMGDLVLLQEEVNPVMSSLLEHGLEVTALHNHFFWEQPRLFYMHIHGHGKAGDLATEIKPALEQIGHAALLSRPLAQTHQIDAGKVAERRGNVTQLQRLMEPPP